MLEAGGLFASSPASGQRTLATPARTPSPRAAVHNGTRASTDEAGKLSPQPDRASEEPSSPSFSIADSDDDSFTGSPIKKRHQVGRTRSADRAQEEEAESAEHGVDALVLPRSEAAAAGASQRSEVDSPKSPIENHSRQYTLEEGEILRRGAALGTIDDEDVEDVSGEVLKREVTFEFLSL